MQGVNVIYFEKNIDFLTTNNSDTDILESRIAYFNSIKNAIETACPGWFNNIEFEIVTDGSIMRYNLYFIIDNIPLLTIRISTGNYSHTLTAITTYNNGNSNFMFYHKGNHAYNNNKEINSISAILYSTNFCGIELSNKPGNYRSTVIMFCKSSINNTSIICPSTLVSQANNGRDLLTAYSEYAESTFNNDENLYISTKTVYSPDSESNNRYSLDNYVLSRFGHSYHDRVAEMGIINGKFILTPVYIGNRSDEYCPGAYYVKNSPVVLSTACNAVLEIGKDFYFTNGIVAFKLT